MNESAVLHACIQWLWANRCFIWRNNTGAYKKHYQRKDGSQSDHWIRYGLNGSADILGMTPNGRFLAVETKAAGNDLSPAQARFRDQVIAHNGLYILARSIDDLEANRLLILG